MNHSSDSIQVEEHAMSYRMILKKRYLLQLDFYKFHLCNDFIIINKDQKYQNDSELGL